MVAVVYGTAICHEISYFEQKKILPAELAHRLTTGFVAAQRACIGKGLSTLNSAGVTPRAALMAAGVTYQDLETLQTVLVDHPVEDEQSNAFYTLYGMVHDKSRYKPFGQFEPGYIAMKFGDTYKHARFGAAHVKLESPVAWRYGGLVYESVRSEFFLTGYGTRAVRVLSEVMVSWLASGAVLPFFVPSQITGEEGFLGKASMAQAEDALKTVRVALYNSATWMEIFGVERGFCTSGGTWVLDKAVDGKYAVSTSSANREWWEVPEWNALPREDVN